MLTIAFLQYSFERMFIYINFISDEIKYFQLGVWSIFYDCLYKFPRNETRSGFYFIAIILTKMKFHFRDKF